jgi:hypothetical protein
MIFREIEYITDHEWNTISFETVSGNTIVEIGAVDSDGDVEICIIQGNEQGAAYFNQENIQQLITHLQKQIR